MRKIYLIAILAAVATACHDKKAASGEDEMAEVSVAKPQVQEVTLTKTYPGTISAAQEVAIVARVSGRLASKNYEAGPVEKGTLLFTIDPTDYADAVSRAEATLESAKAQRIYAASHLEALQEALKADAVSKMEVEQAESSLRQIDADIKSAQATLNDARTQLSYCTIRAPFAGRVATNMVDVSTILTAGTQLTTLYNEEHFTAKFNIEDTQYLTMTAKGEKLDGTEMKLNFSEALPHDYHATLSYVSPGVDKSTGTYAIEGKVMDPYGALRSGMYVTIELPYEHLDSAIVVNTAAISTDQRGDYLYTVSPDSTVTYTHITAGPTINDSLTVVLSGLERNMPYVTKALLKVRPGEKIKPRYE